MVAFLVLSCPFDPSAPFDIIISTLLVSGTPTPGSAVSYETANGRLERVVEYVGSVTACKKWSDEKWKEKQMHQAENVERVQRSSRCSTPFDPTPALSKKRTALPSALAASIAKHPAPLSIAASAISKRQAPPLSTLIIPPHRLSHPGTAAPTTTPSDLDHWRRDIEEQVRETKRLAADTNEKVGCMLLAQAKMAAEVAKLSQTVNDIAAGMPKARNTAGYRGIPWLSREEVEELYGSVDTASGFVRVLLDAVASPQERDLPVKEWDASKMQFCKEQMRVLCGAAEYKLWNRYVSKYKNTVDKRWERSGFFPRLM